MADLTPRLGDGSRALPPATPRLHFRTWTEADVPLARSLWGDADVMRYLHQGPYSEAQIGDRLAREASNLATLGFQYWPIFVAGSGEFAGCCGLKLCPYEGTPEAPELEVGFHLVPAMWGRGLATEAAQAAIRFAFEQVGADRLFAGHHPENAASGAVLRKLGFVFVRDVFYEPTGLMHPLYVLERSR